MNFCSNPHSLISIELNELIGKSLNTINTNFSLLNEQICLENNFLNQFEKQCIDIELKILNLDEELRKKSPFAYVSFNGSGTILKRKEISSVNKISLGTYKIDFSFSSNNYLFSSSLVSLTPGFLSSISETPTSVTITVREQNGNLFDPEKISLIFFT